MQTDPSRARRGLAALFAVAALVGGAACGDDDDAVDVDVDGEQLEENVNEGVEDIEDNVDEGADDIQDELDGN